MPRMSDRGVVVSPSGFLFLFTDPPPSWLGNLGTGYKGKMAVDFGL